MRVKHARPMFKTSLDVEEGRTTPLADTYNRSYSEQPSTPTEAGVRQPQAPHFIIPLPPQLLVACDARLVLATEVTSETPALFKWFADDLEIPANIQALSSTHWTSGQNQSTLVLEPPIKCQQYTCLAQNQHGETRTETHLVDEKSEEAAQIRTKHAGGTEASSRLLENITTIVKTDVERELIRGDSDSDDSAADTVRIYSAGDIPSEEAQPTLGEAAPPLVHETVKSHVVVEPIGDFPQKPGSFRISNIYCSFSVHPTSTDPVSSIDCRRTSSIGGKTAGQSSCDHSFLLQEFRIAQSTTDSRN